MTSKTSMTSMTSMTSKTDRDSMDGFLSGAVMSILSLKAEFRNISQAVEMLVAALRSGGKIMACGNGGSACEAAHFVEELIGRYDKIRKPLAAINLAGDVSVLTCIGNDYGFENIFSRQVEGIGKAGDVLIVFSTSGDSDNVCLATQKAKELGIKTIGLVGGKNGGGRVSKGVDILIRVNSVETSHIQEAHQVLLHLLLTGIEGKLFNE